MRGRQGFCVFVFLILAPLKLLCSAESGEQRAAIRVASFNLANYLVTDRVVEGVYRFDYPKPEAEKNALRRAIVSVKADVLAVQEIGDADFVRELQEDLRREGLDYPYLAWLDGPDEARHLAVFSRHPIQQVIAHKDLDFSYFGGREVVKRGVLEVVFDSPAGPWHLFNLHLKSRYTDLGDDPQSVERRVGEARAIRDLVRERVDAEGGALMPLLVVGDFNDTRSSRALRRFLEINGEPFLHEIPCLDSRGERWTHYYAREDVYSRVDYILASPALLPWLPGETGRIADDPEFRAASDHRLIWVDLVPVSKK
jgi:endonuclease/exonuclease/phosphatase family metal-dependent hydrolase